MTPYHAACPHSGEPQTGSTITVRYAPKDRLIELHAIAQYLAAFSVGDEAVDLETVAQRTARDAGAAVGVPVVVVARYLLRGGLEVVVTCHS
jgi:NADPH-dependent 7-cyano-7-deazaguanine reductase QueF